MGKIFARRIIAGSVKYADVPDGYKAATLEALHELTTEEEVERLTEETQGA